MKKTLSNNRILAAVLAVVLALTCLAGCGSAKASIVDRKADSYRGTGFHTGL